MKREALACGYFQDLSSILKAFLEPLMLKRP